MLKAAGVEFAYGLTPVLHSVSLCVRPGEVTALVGPSGSGKSTLIAVLAGSLAASEGQVEIDGGAIGVGRRPPGLAQVFQDYRLVPFISAHANISLAVELSGRLGADDVKERCGEVLEAVGLKDKGDRLPIHLSGGEQQRVAIARAIATGPRYLLADEPTGSLDAANSVRTAELLVQVARRRQVGILVATHDPLVSELADEVVNIRDGCVMAAAVA